MGKGHRDDADADGDEERPLVEDAPKQRAGDRMRIIESQGLGVRRQCYG